MVATLKDIAKRAGVSLQVASAVLNRTNTTSGAAPATRKKILRIAQQLRYVPNASAASLARGKSHTIGVIAYWLTEPHYVRALDVAERLCAQHGYGLQISRPRHSPDWIALLQSRQVDMLLVLGVGDLDLAGMNVPMPLRSRIAMVGGIIRGGTPRPINRQWAVQYTWDNYTIGQMAAEYLLSRGRRHIAFHAGLPIASDKAPGFVDRLAKEGVKPIFFHQDSEQDRPTAGYQFLKQLAKDHREVDGIFLFSDELYPGVSLAIAEGQWKRPGEYSIVGYGGYYGCLTSVRPPLATCVERVLTGYFKNHSLRGQADAQLEPTLDLSLGERQGQ